MQNFRNDGVNICFMALESAFIVDASSGLRDAGCFHFVRLHEKKRICNYCIVVALTFIR